MTAFQRGRKHVALAFLLGAAACASPSTADRQARSTTKAVPLKEQRQASAPTPHSGERPESSRACSAGTTCCPSALVGFCRVGCPNPVPVPIRRVPPNITTLSKPPPKGIAILELGINEEGRVVSACVLRGLRGDFDRAAQAAALQWLWTSKVIDGKRVGVVATVTFGSEEIAKVK